MMQKLFLTAMLSLAGLCAQASANTIANTPEAAVPGACLVLTPVREPLARQDADDAADEATPKKRKVKVSKAIADLDYITEKKPSTKAKYYIYLCSASWCGPCNAEMPHVVKAYPKMKKDKVELILVSADRTEKAAEAFLEKYEATFPAIMSASSRKLPGFTPPQGIPHAIIVNARGEVLQAGHGSIALKWKEIIDSKKSGSKKSKNKKS